MNSAITILDLSDLHIRVSSQNEQEALFRFRTQLCDHIGKNGKWWPDYIIIAGDIVDARTLKSAEARKDAYNLAQTTIETLARDLEISDRRRIITVPGNHDKDILSGDDGDKDYFEKLCKDNGKTSTAKNDFVAAQQGHFELFSDFYKSFVGTDDDNYQYTSFFDDTSSLHEAEGLKIFHDQKLCFLCVNTEWLYPNEKDLARYCRPSIQYLCKAIHGNDFRDYTVVTLAHRKPSIMSADEVYGKNREDQNTLNLLVEHSDIMFSGHDHSTRSLVPDNLENHVQHFNLGSPNVVLLQNQAHPLVVSLIRIDVVELKIELMNGLYDRVPHQHSEMKWQFRDGGTYRLRDKYHRYNDNGKIEYFDWAIRIRAKSSAKEDIRQAICSHFEPKHDSGCVEPAHGVACYLPVDNVELGLESERIRLSDHIGRHLVIYAVYDGLISLAAIARSIRDMRAALELESDVNTLTGKMMVSFALIDIPNARGEWP